MVHDDYDDDIGSDDKNTRKNPPNNIEIDPPEIEQEDTRELEDEQPITANNEPTGVNPIISASNTHIDNPSDRGVRRSSHTPKPVKDYEPSFSGKCYYKT